MPSSNGFEASHHDPRLSFEGYGFSEAENGRYSDEEGHSAIRRPRHKRDDRHSSSQNSKDSYVSSDEDIDTAPTVPQVKDANIIVVRAAPELLLDIRISKSISLAVEASRLAVDERNSQLIGKALWSRTQQRAAHPYDYFAVDGLQKSSRHVVLSWRGD